VGHQRLCDASSGKTEKKEQKTEKKKGCCGKQQPLVLDVFLTFSCSNLAGVKETGFEETPC